MHQQARQATILKALELQGSCAIGELAQRLAVSDETIRRDVKALANKGLVERVHGGVMLPALPTEPAFQKRMRRNPEAKAAIARLTAAQVHDGDSIMLDTGSTTAYVARALRDHRELLVVTNCTEIARTLGADERNRVHLAGGELRADDGAVFGPSAIAFVERFRVGTAILSIGAINLDDGFMDFHLAEAEFSQAVIRSATQVVVVADHSKFGSQATVRVCGLGAVDMVVTDRQPPSEYAARLADAGVTLLVTANR